MFIQRLVKLPTITSNKCNRMEQDEIIQYGNYEQPWKLDCGGSCGCNCEKKHEYEIERINNMESKYKS